MNHFHFPVRRPMNPAFSVIAILTVALAGLIFTVAVASGEDFPIKKFRSQTWVVDYEPCWSPDGSKIALISSRHGGMHVHIFTPSEGNNGSDMKQLTSGAGEDDAPAWSPDGEQIAFISLRDDV